ncbi:MAG: ABC transporter substrate-binding protein [Pseudomonadota bacterium]
MGTTRRHMLRTLGGGLGAGLLGPAIMGGSAVVPVRAQAGRALNVNLLGFALGIHVPAMASVFDLLPATPGYAAPKTNRMDQIRTLTQTLVAGAAEIGETDPPTLMSAVEAGADLKIVGLLYSSTSLVFIVNADKIKELKDLEKPDNVVAVNQRGDITHVMLVGPLLRQGIDVKKLTMVDIGGSGARMRALLSGRVHAVPVHFDQAAEVAKQGNYKVLIEPWKEYRAWINEVWAVPGAWLKRRENERAVVDFLKANLTARRKANADLAWYTDAYRRHVTLPNAKDATPEILKPLWEGLAREVKAWPNAGDFNPDDLRELIPVYKTAEAIAGTIKVEQVVETSFLQQAVRELGG